MLRLLLDFGLLILIWMVQLVIYPSFAYYSSKELIQWHQKYTLRIAYIVIPLMLGQLMIGVYQLIDQFSFYSIVYVILILGVWVITFAKFVPMHNNISRGKADEHMLKQLVHINWWRTLLWTFIGLYSLFLLPSLC